MTRIKALNRYQKAVLIVMGVMILIFTVLYFRTISRVGFEYQDTIFVPYQENGSMVYSGKFQGKQSHFTVSEKKTVMFQWGDMVYGPYTAKEDPAAIPKDDEFAQKRLHESNCLLSCFPEELQNAICPRAIKSDTVHHTGIPENVAVTRDRL